jgi:hypothetical protein
MKIILSLVIGGALVVSGFGQTRNVLVGTNNAVVQPTNFWSADAVNARAGLGLGSAATNPASAFQPSSLNLSNVSANNGGELTNLNAANLVGVVNVAQGGTGSTNASDARTALGLGTAATNPATAFQSSSATLSNLATSNGGGLTNLQSTNLVGFIPSSNLPSFTFTNLSGTLAIAQGGTGATNAANARQNLGSTTVGDAVFTATNPAAARLAMEALATNGDAINLTNFPAILLRTNGDGSSLTNLTAANITGTVALASNVSGVVAITNGGSGATTAGGARTNFGLGSTNAVAFSNLALSSGVATNLPLTLGSTNRGFYATSGPERISTVVGGVGALQVFSNSVETGSGIGLSVSGVGSFSTNIQIGGPLSFSGANASNNANATRTNLGLGWSALTNSNAGVSLVSVDTNGEVVSPTNFWQVAPIVTRFVEFDPATNATTNIVAARNLHIHSLAISRTGVTSTIALPTTNSFDGDIALVVHQGPTSSVTAVRTAGAGTNLVTLNQFDEAVEFVYYNNVWQFNHNRSFVEPIYFSGTNAAVNAAASRTNLGLGNIFTNVVSIFNSNTAVFINTNLIATNGAGLFTNLQTDYFEIGDYIFVADSTNTNTIVFEDPSQKTNFTHGLGLGPTNSVTFASLTITNSTDNLVASLEGGSSGFPLEIYSTDEQLETGYGSNNFAIGVGGFGFQIKYGTNSSDWGYPVLTSLGGTNLLQPSNVTNFRSAIGIPLPALTNTNNANFQAAVFNTNAAPTPSVNFGDAVAWLEITVQTNGTNASFRIPLYEP